MKIKLRFDPPQVDVTPAMAWVLLRAFGPVEAPAPVGFDATAVVGLAGRFDLAPRIAARVGEERLAVELGAAAARELAVASLMAEARGEVLRRLAVEVAGVAAAAGVPLALIKFAGLLGAGVIEPGTRWAADLDVLAPVGRAQALVEALVARGFRRSGLPSSDQHLPPLHDPAGTILEIHRYLQGVRIARRAGFASFEQLADAGLLVDGQRIVGCWVPARDVLLAGTVGHGLGHHGLKPREYPLLRMVADAIDLGLGGEVGDAQAIRIMPWLDGSVPGGEIIALQRLCAALAAGEDARSIGARGRPEGVLLRHVVAGVTDDRYAQSLEMGSFVGRLSHLPRPVAVGRAIWHGAVLNRAQIDKIYGAQRSSLGYLAYGLWRPVHFAWQGIRSVSLRLARLTARLGARGPNGVSR